jgi:hypothetical protein
MDYLDEEGVGVSREVAWEGATRRNREEYVNRPKGFPRPPLTYWATAQTPSGWQLERHGMRPVTRCGRMLAFCADLLTWGLKLTARARRSSPEIRQPSRASSDPVRAMRNATTDRLAVIRSRKRLTDELRVQTNRDVLVSPATGGLDRQADKREGCGPPSQHALFKALGSSESLIVVALPSCQRQFRDAPRQLNLALEQIHIGEDRPDLAEQPCLTGRAAATRFPSLEGYSEGRALFAQTITPPFARTSASPPIPAGS